MHPAVVQVAPSVARASRINAPVFADLDADIVNEVSAALGLTTEQVRQVSASVANTICSKLFIRKAVSVLGLWHARLLLRRTATAIRDAARNAAARGRSGRWRFKKWAITIKTRPRLKRMADIEPIPLALQ